MQQFMCLMILRKLGDASIWFCGWIVIEKERNIAFEVYCCATNSHLNIWRTHFSVLIEIDIHETVQRALYIANNDIVGERHLVDFEEDKGITIWPCRS